MSAVCELVSYGAFTVDYYNTLQLSSFSIIVFHTETLIAQPLSFMFIHSSAQSQLSSLMHAGTLILCVIISECFLGCYERRL